MNAKDWAKTKLTQRESSDLGRYEKAMHAMQSGVAFVMNSDPMETQPKHLRVGVNSSLVNNDAIARILFGKGVLTREEYFGALADAAEDEAERYRVRIRNLTGCEVTLL